jgi:superfamily II DNA or RNA helicase
MSINNILEKLKKFTEEGNIEKVYQYLNEDIGDSELYKNTKEKGDILEYYLKFLYEAYGFKVKINGGAGDRGVDLEIYKENDLKKPIIYMQVKNKKHSQNIDDIRNDMQKFQSEYGMTEEIEKKFKFFALNGFTKETKEKVEGRYSLETFEDIGYLIKNYKSEKNRNKSKQRLEYLTDLLPHNEYAYKEAKEMAKTDKKVGIVQPTGTGKMYIANQFIVDFALKSKEEEKALFVAPTIDIIEKIKKLSPYATEKIEYMTYAKASKLTEKEIKKYNFKEMYLDEFHRNGAEEWGAGIKRIIKESKELDTVYGLSATPERPDGKDMAEEMFEDNLAQEMDLGEAIARGLLNPPKYISSIYSIEEETEELKEKIENSNLSNEEKTEAKEKLNKAAIDWENSAGVDKILKKHIEEQQELKKRKEGKFIIFCKNKEHMEQMEIEAQKWFKKTGLYKRVSTYAVTSEYGEEYNKEQLELFENKHKMKEECKLLFAIDKLNEGLHVKDIDGVVLLRRTTSNIVFSQQIGRALSVGDEHSSIIFDLVNNFQNIKQIKRIGTNFNKELSKKIKEEKEKRKEIGLKEREIKEVEIIDEVKDIIEIYQEISEKIKGTKQKIKENIKKIKEIKEKTGKLPSTKDENQYYASWALKIKKYVKIEGEETLKIKGWEKEDIENFFNLYPHYKKEEQLKYQNIKEITNKEKLEKIKEIKEKTGKTPSAKAKKEEDRYLGEWASTQNKQIIKKGIKGMIEELGWKEADLNTLFEIYPKYHPEVRKEKDKLKKLSNKEKLEKIKEIKEKTGKLPSKISKIEEERYLGEWVLDRKKILNKQGLKGLEDKNWTDDEIKLLFELYPHYKPKKEKKQIQKIL